MEYLECIAICEWYSNPGRLQSRIWFDVC